MNDYRIKITYSKGGTYVLFPLVIATNMSLPWREFATLSLVAQRGITCRLCAFWESKILIPGWAVSVKRHHFINIGLISNKMQ